MSILVKGMEMPKSCADCPIGDTLCCSLMPGVPALWKEYTLALRTNRRHKDCPLVPVQPHGDLIDRKELIKDDHQHYEYMSDEFYVTVRDIECAPTIIPADPPKEEVSDV